MNPLFEKLEKMGLKTSGDPNERLPVTRADVESVEAFFGFPFPPLYDEFAERYGKCYFDHAYAFFSVPDDWNEQSEGATTCVFGIDGLDLEQEEKGWGGLRSTIEGGRSSGVPDYFLSLASTDSDESVAVYLCCGEKNYGHVYAMTTPHFWALDDGSIKTEQVIEIAIHLADSFEQFSDGITVVPPQALSEAFDGPPKIDPLFVAFHAGDVAYLQKIVDADEMASYRSKYDQTLLQCAVVSRLDWPVEFLLERGAPIEGALWMAVANEVPQAARLLLAQGADPNEPSKHWRTPLIEAVRSQNYDKKYDMARFLISAGADATLPDSDGKTAWDYVHPRNQVMRDILKESVPVPPEERAKYILPTKSETSL